jgi:hypothetical protein
VHRRGEEGAAGHGHRHRCQLFDCVCLCLCVCVLSVCVYVCVTRVVSVPTCRISAAYMPLAPPYQLEKEYHIIQYHIMRPGIGDTSSSNSRSHVLRWLAFYFSVRFNHFTLLTIPLYHCYSWCSSPSVQQSSTLSSVPIGLELEYVPPHTV